MKTLVFATAMLAYATQARKLSDSEKVLISENGADQAGDGQ